MSAMFKCRIPEHDGEEWTDVKDCHWDEMAARTYAEDRDSNSAMELFQDDAEVIVEVQNMEGVITRFKCSRESCPVYSATELDPKPEPACDIPI